MCCTAASASDNRPMPRSGHFAAIFDLDGTLVDSYDAHFDAWRTVAGEIGHRLTVEQFARQFGRTNDPILRELFEWVGREPPEPGQLRSLADRKESLFRSAIEEAFPAMTGGRELLQALRKDGWRLAVGSSAPPDNVALAVAGLEAGTLFEAVVHGDDVTHGKPDPEVFLLAANRLGVAPASCVVVEDAPPGLEAARRAGMASIGLASKGRTREELAAADLVVDSLEELDPRTFLRIVESRS